ncbi:S-adenosylmethionine-dependent methyltransferase [Lignoscripta atroalba]|nr:S-adenosylmethionine-dependent methyltransferase [Lignoscripta atroalba]
MLPTPSTSHVDTNKIYDPAEDSFLLLDTLSSPLEVDFLTQRFSVKSTVDSCPGSSGTPVPLVLEVGTGSGVVLAFITAHANILLGRPDVLTLGVDINRFACQATKATVAGACHGAAESETSSAMFLDALHADLTAPLRFGIVDILVFNPPYVPTSELPNASIPGVDDASGEAVPQIGGCKADSHLLSLSYAGGRDGMEVTDRLLRQLPQLLHNERGVAYILLCEQNKPEEVKQQIRGWSSLWAAETVGRSGKSAGWEKLQIVKIWRL